MRPSASPSTDQASSSAGTGANAGDKKGGRLAPADVQNLADVPLWSPDVVRTFFFEFDDAERDRLPGAIHPLVRTLPATGRRSLYLASHAARIVDWPLPEGRLLLRDLIEHATRTEFIYRHEWQPRDLVIWDNRTTMHRARPFDDRTHRRELRRTTTLDLPLPERA